MQFPKDNFVAKAVYISASGTETSKDVGAPSARSLQGGYLEE